jgi:hypothetical protein
MTIVPGQAQIEMETDDLGVLLKDGVDQTVVAINWPHRACGFARHRDNALLHDNMTRVIVRSLC